MELERRGVPTVTVIGTRFRILADYERQALGLPELPLAEVEYPFGGVAPAIARERGIRAFSQVMAGLTGRPALPDQLATKG